MTFAEGLRRGLERDPDRLALVDARDGSAFTLAEVDLLVARGIAWLRQQGLRPGDRLLVVASPDIEVLVVIYAAMAAGVVPLVLHPGSPQARIDEMAAAAQVRARLLATPDPRHPECACAGPSLTEALLAATPADPPPPPDPDQDAAILFSSGSTGPSKGIRLSHRALAEAAMRVSRAVRMRPGERCGIPALLHGITGLRFSLLSAVLDDSVSVLLSPDGDVATLLEQCARARVRVIHVPPGFVRAFNLAPERLRALSSPELRAVVSGGAALTLEERRAFATGLGVTLHHTYGATETAGTVTSGATTPDGAGEPGVGRPPVPIVVLDDAGRPCPPGVEGLIEIAARPPFTGYLDGTGPVERDGERWVRTGDLGYTDADGYLHVLGRRARQHEAPTGEKVLLDDLETVIRDTLRIDAVTATIRSPRRAARIGVLVEREALTDVWLGQAKAALLDRLPPHAVPSVWRSLPRLPRLPGGKLDLEGARRILESDA